MKRFITIVTITLLTLSAWAVPARRIFSTYTQPDGTQLKMMLVGDEHMHYLMTEDGIAMHRDSETGYYVPIEKNVLKESRLLASQRRLQSNQRRAARASERRNIFAAAPTRNIGERDTIIGYKKALVILVNFSDVTLKSTQKEFDEMFNKKGYNKNNHIGSVRDYFLSQSCGALDIEFDVIGPVNLSKASTFYGKDRGMEQDINGHLMVIEACKAVDKQVNFADYDWNDDGEADQVFIIHAGYGANYGGEADWLWPAEWTLGSAAYYYPTSQYPLELDGVQIETFAYAPELAYDAGSTLNGIGTACHEFAHCLGLMDAYDSDYNLCPSMFDWDLMDSGSYNGDNSLGEVPAGLTAYERWTAGWLEFTELREHCTVENMPALGDSPCAYIIYNEGSPNEAYILENRQNTGWYSYPSYAHGLLIYHVDYKSRIWENNEINVDPSHPRLCVVPASGEYGDRYEEEGVISPTVTQYRGHVWPGSKGKASFTDYTTPASTLFNENADGTTQLGVPILSIKETKGKISFEVGALDTPEAVLANDPLKEGSAEIRWNSVNGAESYEVRVASTFLDEKPSEILKETMTSCVASTFGSVDLSNELDDYLDNVGWMGLNVYTGPYGAKLGTSNNPGILMSPDLEVEGDITVKAQFTAYSSDDARGRIVLVDANGQILSSAEYTANGTLQTFTLKGATNPCNVLIYPNKRVSVKNLSFEAWLAKVESYTIENLTETQYNETLGKGCTYHIKVRAKSKSGYSVWSKDIVLGEDTAIEEICMSQPQDNRTYDLMGRRKGDGAKGLTITQGRIVLKK